MKEVLTAKEVRHFDSLCWQKSIEDLKSLRQKLFEDELRGACPEEVKALIKRCNSILRRRKCGTESLQRAKEFLGLV